MVLEDDIIPTSETHQIAAVNIQPITKAQEKIIIRGALIPTKDSPFDMFKEYTRFVPPTTAGVTRIDGNIVLAPVKPIIHTSVPSYGAEIKYGHDRNSQHAFNPLPSTQSQTSMTRQYAPIAPVLFTRRNTMSALTPRAIDKFDDVKFNEQQFRKLNFENTVQSIQNIDNESDISYNDLFYNDDNNERTTNKWQQSSKDNYDFHNQNHDDNNLDKGFNATKKANELDESKKASSIEQSIINYEDNEYGDTVNISVSLTGEKSSTTVLKTKISKAIENDHNKRNSVCTVLKLRQLSFSSPLTLHEIVAQLKQWAGASPVAQWLDITKGNFTVMENPIYMMIVDDLSSGQIISAKKTVMIVAGRESCQACEEFGIRCTIQSCYGVNLDRNFEYQWIPGKNNK
ncbi:uncharacterized protein LOC123872080 [Maniola jurtina]|uniref:uncharacterized protein LOC123872080 n=1 Tax=Maniola jurtina TaxID=191418 RepID=UPI001E68F77B|nr:uncharacterized protein LOC123872080 [Maniola jurtina]